jgi:hypothetical protein
MSREMLSRELRLFQVGGSGISPATASPRREATLQLTESRELLERSSCKVAMRIDDRSRTFAASVWGIA